MTITHTNTVDVPPGIATPDRVESRLGALNFTDGVPDAETAQKLFDELDYVHAVTAFINGYAAVNMLALLKGFRAAGVNDNDVLVTSGLMDAKSLFMTANADTYYLWSYLDLSKGPLVVETPPETLGIIDDMWWNWISDFGFPGADRGLGGKYLLLPPGYTGEVPEGGFYVRRSRTNHVSFLGRAFLQNNDPKPADEIVKKTLKIYPYRAGGEGSSIANYLKGQGPLGALSTPVGPRFVEGTGRVMNTIPPVDFSFWEMLNEAVQAEPAEAMDPEIAGQIAAIGIVKGKPFNPDARMKKILTDALAVANGASRAVSLAPRPSDGFGFYGADSQWVNGLFVGGYDFMTPPPEVTKDGVKPYPSDGARKLNSRIWFFYSVTGITPAMCMRLENVGSQYLQCFRDSQGKAFDGSQTYKVMLPPNIPAARFWSFTVYDNQTRSMLDTPQRYPRAGSQSYPSPAAESNADGSTTVYFGPTQPDGVARGNWIQTMPGKGWFTIIRLYSPLRPFFDKSWRPSEIELVKVSWTIVSIGAVDLKGVHDMSSEDKRHRSHLPMANTWKKGLITFDAKDPASKFPPIDRLRPPKGAPNVLIVLIDDVGFGATSAFGGPCQTPTAEKLAAGGLKFTRFHTTALCSPTRQALLTGRNHHSAGMGGITEIATGAPGYCSVLPNSMSPLARTLKLNGYSTAQFGKCHEVPVWETSPAGPFDAWPTGGGGFEYFYGFIGGEANQWYPTLYEGTTSVEPEKTPEEGYHLVEDMTDKAIAWIGQQKSLAPDKPFFIYFAPGATHAPHHVPKEWADKYKGKFDGGWDKLREETFARQKKLGVIPADCQLTARHKEIPAWDEMPEPFKPVLRREMEVYAGFMEYTDHHVGRLVESLTKLGIADDTLIYYIAGDNGASAEGSLNGCYNEMSYFNGLQALETPEYLTARIDKLGGPESYNHYAVGWAHAMNTPYQWTKQVASHWGGTRNGTIVHWPKGIKGKGELRSQFSHVIDVAPTILEVAGIPEPLSVNGLAQSPIEGVSMLYAFNDAKAAERHETQYFEMFGNRGIYHQGWTAVTRHTYPWSKEKPPALDDDVWELYDTNKDWSQSKNLAKQMPEKLHDLQRLWLIEATRYNVLPIDDRLLERVNPDLAGRPVLIEGKTQVLFGGMGRLSENCVLSIKNKSHSITAEIVVPEKGAEGVIIAQGANIGGWSLYATAGKLKYCYNWGGFKHFMVEATTPIPAGEHQVRLEFAYDGGGLGKGGTVTLYTDGKQVGEGKIEATLTNVFSADDGCDVGEDTGAPVSPDYGPHGNAFNGRIKGVQLAIAEAAESTDHLVDPEAAIRVAMARQ